MKLLNSLKLLTLLSLIYSVYGQSKPATQTINVQIYDQFPKYNKNFEPENGKLTKNIVKKNLNVIPELNYPSPNMQVNVDGRILSPKNFPYFFSPHQTSDLSDDSGLNYPLTMDLTLNYDEKNGVYIYDNQNFFPIDFKGFDQNATFRIYKDFEKPTQPYHNYHFCLKMNNKFTYQGNEVFNFIGDDDVWVFIDGKLVVDLGGLHEAESGNVDLTTLGLVKGKVYTFDFFYCERHTSKSTIRIETSIELFCAKLDYCGVCNGDGATCCNPITNCNDNNLCTIDSCPPVDITIDPSLPFNSYCNHMPQPDPFSGSKCYHGECNPKTGQWTQNFTSCPDKSNECKKTEPCDNNNGCMYSNICVDRCSVPNKCVGGKCITKTESDCAAELDGKADPCFIYSCNANSGCVKEPKCKKSDNPCEIITCNASSGKCENETLSGNDCCKDKCNLNKCQYGECNKADGSCIAKNLTSIDDGNLCTIDQCDPNNGNVTHTLINKCTGCMTCDPKTGGCIPKDSLCEDGNPCTDEKCSADPKSATNGVCNKKPTTKCDGGSKCKVYTCDMEKGCNSTALICPDKGKCQVGYCDEKLGCVYKKRECTSSAFCLEAECDEKFGCITYPKRCAADNSRCQEAICINATATEKGKCVSKDYDPKPFICKTAAVVSTAVVAGVVVAGAVALGAAIFAGKKGYDYWKDSQATKMTASNSNPLYEANPSGGENPLYANQG
ncbi:hypothetical protein DICPUDRAFT_91542 [Dictyostelium purpureum]|uniref:PA14 domain-containing protein n=1 Tax=Dictyostelium purpureum TaxID=5786 RepID=F0ZE00_DICPU|nr:uncharacterized protein DICPUDRAFT_91542 [Dictyostelium purpureum]EGC37828.1 hypothetical protein DICPUDRAFT_91542 [Dictyostelium purpureum]|eukprot:XP_003285673.1 hypothetical protein DICPUDRAFT_91542 [Dictyostelium purpureum]